MVCSGPLGKTDILDNPGEGDTMRFTVFMSSNPLTNLTFNYRHL